MIAPLLIALWRCACGTVDLYADQQWSEVRKLAASYEMDIDHAMDPIPVVPAAENFMSQPYLQACLFHQEGEAVKPMVTLADKCHDVLTNSLASLDAGSTTRLSAILEVIRTEAPGFLPAQKAEGPTAEILLKVTNNLAIPWSELKNYSKLPHSQIPPLGTVPPSDDWTPPALSSFRSSDSLIKLMRITGLRAHVALALKQPGTARDCLEMESRVVDGHFDHPTLLNAIRGAWFVQSMISQIHAGFRDRQWRDEDIRWFAAWSRSIDVKSLLTEGSKMECVYAIRYVASLKTDPGVEDRMVRYLDKNTATRETRSDVAVPFRQEWLRPFRGRSETLYRLCPTGLFTLIQTSTLRTYCDDYLSLLKKGGLHEYGWPEKDNRVSNKLFSYNRLGIGFAANQSRVNLLRSACALHQWHVAHGDYPEKLDELQPALPASACLDVCAAKPLHYERISKDNYRLYAVGMDAVDDGGKPVVDGKGDIVWK